MRDKDKQLIEQAESLGYTRWGEIDHLIEQAESEEAKRELETIQKILYKREESHAGLL